MKKDFRIYLIAKMHYVDHMKQNDIAQAMGISNMMVSRMIKQAEEEGIVTFHVHAPNKINWELGKKVKDRYPNLKEALVVMPDDDEDPRQIVAEAAAEYVQGLVEKESIIGLSWGRTILEFVNALRAPGVPDLKVLQMSGGFLCEKSIEMMPANLVKVASEHLNANPYFLSAPMFVTSAEVRQSLMMDPLLQYLDDMFGKTDISVYGLSELDQATSMKEVGIVNERDIEELKAKGAVGDVMGYFLNAAGQIVEWSKTPCYMGASLQTASKAPNAICLATGAHKSRIMKLALEHNYCNTVIISYDLAYELLQ